MTIIDLSIHIAAALPWEN